MHKKIHTVSEKASMAMEKSFITAHLLQTLLVFSTTDDQFCCIADDRSSSTCKASTDDYFASMAIDGSGDQGDDDDASDMHPTASIVSEGGRRRI